MPTVPPSSQLYRHACREAVVVVLVWLTALLWTVGYCYLAGYRHPPDSWLVQQGLAAPPGVPFRQVLGLPSWVFFGIVAPWLAASVVTVLFARFGMADDDLGQDQGGAA